MLRATWKLQLMAVGFVGLFSGSAKGDDVAAATAQIGGKASGVIKNISDAFQGGQVGVEAQNALIELAGQATFVLALLFFCYIAASWTGRIIGGVVSSKVDVTLGKFLNRAVRNLIMLVVGMVALEKCLEVNVAGFAAILAAASFAVGMALQGTLSNFAAGVMLLVFRPFKVDDYIAVAGTEGRVEEIDLFTTRLNALDNRHLIVPNGEIFGAKLENYTRNPLRRVDVNVGAAYSANIDSTRRALQRAVEQIDSASEKLSKKTEIPDPQVYLVKLGASSVDWQLRVWCHHSAFWDVREDLTAAAKEALEQAGISIPFPQMDVHVVGKVMAKAA